jgi:hypothetical protein
MPSHAVSITCRRLTCGPKFVSVVFLSIWAIPRTPIPHSSPPSPNPSSARRSCTRGRGLARQPTGAALLRVRTRPADATACATQGSGSARWPARAEAARLGCLRVLSLVRASEPADSPFTSSNPGPDATGCESPNPSLRGGLRWPIPLLPPRIRARRGGLRRTLNPRRGGLRSARTRLGGRPAQRADVARQTACGRGGLRKARTRLSAAACSGLPASAEHRASFPTTVAPTAQSTGPPSQRRQHLQRPAREKHTCFLPNDGAAHPVPRRRSWPVHSQRRRNCSSSPSTW